MGRWKLSKREFERLKKKTVRKVVERKFQILYGKRR